VWQRKQVERQLLLADRRRTTYQRDILEQKYQADNFCSGKNNYEKCN
jgi:hypothetical protein